MAVNIKKMTVTTTPQSLDLASSDVKDYKSVIIKPMGAIKLLHSEDQPVTDGYPLVADRPFAIDLRRGENIFLVSDNGSVVVNIMAQGV